MGSSAVAPSLTDWLTAIGGLLVFLATVGLAVVAVVQMKAASRASAKESKRLDKQIAASIAQGEAVREAARAQLQPIVFAHGERTLIGGNAPTEFLHDREVGFMYRLKNEGTGIALNIRHGIEIAGTEYEYLGGMQWRVLGPGEATPHSYVDGEGQVVAIEPFMVPVDKSVLPENWQLLPRHYWTRFQSVFEEHFETQNPNRPEQPARIRRIDGPNSS